MNERQRQIIERDMAAARVHRRKAEEHYQAAERFRQQGLTKASASALLHARQQDDLADLLEGVEPDPGRAGTA